MSAGEANKKVNSATKIIHLVSVPQVRDNACQETLLIDSEREEKLWKKLVLSSGSHCPLKPISFPQAAGLEIYFLRGCFDCAHCFVGCYLAFYWQVYW